MVVRCHYALNHSVGESFWSIPPSEDFYSKWSANHFFRVGDSLVFEFETNFHDVIQVSKRHYENCCTERPLQTFRTGPATVTLAEVGVYYFICSVANYCLLGQKLSVVVHSLIPAPPLQQPPPFSPSLSPAWPPHPSSPPVDPTSPAPAHGSLPVPSSSAPATKTRPVVQPSESPALIRSCSALAKSLIPISLSAEACVWNPLTRIMMMQHPAPYSFSKTTSENFTDHCTPLYPGKFFSFFLAELERRFLGFLSRFPSLYPTTIKLQIGEMEILVVDGSSTFRTKVHSRH
ncbi:blue copper protein-like [Aristolochia californica]|uniref:blue copper protein-like n=1 Tax=Aristolochia californica TaxID=171875 RepID=UPI0035DB056B